MQQTFTVNNLGLSLGNIISIDNTQLIYGPGTYLSRDTTNTTFNYVENSTYLSVAPANRMYLVGNLGSENAEINQVISVTLPTNAVPSAVTLNSILVNRHARGESLTNIAFNSIAILSATSEAGPFNTIANISIQVNSLKTTFNDVAGLATTVYKIQFNNTTSGNFAPQSTSITSSSTSSPNSVGYLINSVKKTLGIKDGDSMITDSFLLEALNEGRRVMDIEIATGQMKEWRQQFEFPIKMLAGTNYVALPLNIDYNETNRSLLNARFSNSLIASAMPIQYLDKKDWNMSAYQRRFATNSAQIAISATTIVLNNSGDLPASGTIIFQSSDFSNAPLSVSYTANNLNTNTLTGVTGVTRVIPINSQAWVSTALNFPVFYTVYDSRIYFDSAIPISLNGRNLYIDYYKLYVDIVSASEQFPEHYKDIYKNYLRFAIKRRRDNTIGETDPDYTLFKKAAMNVAANSYTGQHIRMN